MCVIKLYDISCNEVNIDTIVFVDEWIDVCVIDVSNTNNYFVSDLNILAGGDDFYAVRLLEALDVDVNHGALRLSFVHFTNKRLNS